MEKYEIESLEMILSMKEQKSAVGKLKHKISRCQRYKSSDQGHWYIDKYLSDTFTLTNICQIHWQIRFGYIDINKYLSDTLKIFVRYVNKYLSDTLTLIIICRIFWQRFVGYININNYLSDTLTNVCRILKH